MSFSNDKFIQLGGYRSFLKSYLWGDSIFNGKALDKSIPDFHKEIYEDAEVERLLVVGCPVRFGKSAVSSFVIPVADACLQRAEKILLISNGSQLAENFLRDIKAVFETNKLLKLDYGDLKGDVWRTDEIKLTNGVEIHAKGWSSNIRGGGYGLIVLDDPENDEEVRSEDRRIAKKEWFSSALFGRLEPEARLLVVGSQIHPLCLVNWIIEDTEERFKDFCKRHYEAWIVGVDNKEHSIWPQRWSDEELEWKRRNMSAKAVASELLGRPIHSEDMKIRPEWIPTYKSKDVPDLEDLYCITAIDPADSEAKGKKRDYDAVGTVGMETNVKNPNFYVLSMNRGHYSRDDKVAIVINQRLKFGSREVIVEGTGGFAELKQDIEKEAKRQNLFISVRVVRPHKDKGVRLENVSVLFEHGRVFIHSNMLRLRDELVMFPTGDHDDEVDVLVHCLTRLKDTHTREQRKRQRQPIYYPPLQPDAVTGRLK